MEQARGKKSRIQNRNVFLDHEDDVRFIQSLQLEDIAVVPTASQYVVRRGVTGVLF